MPISTRAAVAAAATADAAAASASTNPTETSSATMKKAGTEETTTETSTASQATVKPATTSSQEHPQKKSPLLAAASQKSCKSKSSKSGRALRLAQAREEMLKIQLQLAAARIAVIEAEESSEDDEEQSHVTEEQKWQKIDEWLEQTEAPQLQAPPPVPRAPAAVAAPTYVTAATDAAPAYAPQLTVADATNPSANVLPPRSSYPQADTYYEDQQERSQPQQNVPTTASQQNVNISELASAIALAAKAGQRATPRYHTELPTFTGSHHEWLSFRAAYYETAESFIETDNVARLRRSLRGRAKEAVENLLILNARADDIMRALESRFGRPDTIAMTEIDRLRALPRPTDNPRDVCIFASRVANVVASLHALDRIHYLYSPEATKSTIEKLTPALRYRWFDYAATQTAEEPDLLKLSRFLQREADNCGPYAQPETELTEQYQKRTQKTYTTVNTAIEKTSKCRHCATEGHHINKCPKFEEIDINSRWEIAKSQRLCFRCLRYRSKTHSCKRNRCGQDGCSYFHHKLLHFTRPAETETETTNNYTVTSTWAPRETHAYLKILPITIVGPAGEVHTHALLDDGSTVTLIDAAIATQAGLTGPIEPLNIAAIADTKISVCQSRRVKVPIQGEVTRYTIKAHTMNNIQLSAQSVKHEDLQNCEHLRDIEHHLKYEAARPKVLIGQDNWQLLIGSEVRQGQRDQPVASHTPLGWVLHGAHTRTLGKSVHNINHLSTQEDEMNAQLSKFFALESLLIEPKRPQNDPAERALAILDERAKETEDGHYEVPLLWKEENINLPDNYENTLRRLHSIEKKIDKDSKLKKRYNEEMNALLQKGYAEPAPPLKTGKRVWYLPHFAVHNPMKPEKVRIVHDAAAKCRGLSLNDCLLTGPDLLQSLPGVLMRFRQHSIAVGADIKEMFMQVKVQPEDRDALRYLWRGDRRDDAPPDEYRMTSLIFGATCSPSIAIYVKNRNASKFEETYPDAAHAIVRNHYVDDYLHSYRTVDEAIKTSEQVRHSTIKLYIDFVHRQLHHAGVETTINEIRQCYWVLRVRPVTRMVLHRCLRCRIAKTRPTEPPTGDHPHSRVAHHERPFTYTGVDYFGPITVSVGRSKQKRYVALFTCLTTRAVHLEMAASLTTDSAIMCLRRLINRRGCPTEIWSDNGSNLRGADKELRLAIDAATEEEACKRAINWRFIPPGAPFMGGAWERLVRSVKTALATVLNDRHPSEEVLLTMLVEVEYSVNSRPLTHVSVDPEDPEAITPNHFLLHGPARNPTPGTFEDSDLVGRAQWRKSQRLADMFWARWLKEYLPSLQYRREPHGRGPALKVNDVVLVVDNTQPRNTWPMGIVIATYPGADGVVRTADIRTRGKILRRATKKLVILPTDPAEPADPHRDCNDNDGVNARRE